MSDGKLRQEVLRAAEACAWVRDVIHGDDGETAKALVGTSASPPARITVAAFEIASQGYPAGTLGYDGAIAFLGEGRMVHLPHDLAEEVYRLADRRTP